MDQLAKLYPADTEFTERNSCTTSFDSKGCAAIVAGPNWTIAEAQYLTPRQGGNVHHSSFLMYYEPEHTLVRVITVYMHGSVPESERLRELIWIMDNEASSMNDAIPTFIAGDLNFNGVPPLFDPHNGNAELAKAVRHRARWLSYDQPCLNHCGFRMSRTGGKIHLFLMNGYGGDRVGTVEYLFDPDQSDYPNSSIADSGMIVLPGLSHWMLAGLFAIDWRSGRQ